MQHTTQSLYRYVIVHESKSLLSEACFVYRYNQIYENEADLWNDLSNVFYKEQWKLSWNNLFTALLSSICQNVDYREVNPRA